jgi:hypothetical protein
MKTTIVKRICEGTLFAFMMLFTQTATANDVLYCQSELATGLLRENGRWQTSNFHLERYTIKFSDDFSFVTSSAFTGEKLNCHPHYLGTRKEIIKCDGVSFTLSFNKESMRFVLVFVGGGGYIDHRTETASDTDNIYAGTCEKF